MGRLKRWAPVIGSLILVASAILQAAGQKEAAQALTTVGGLLGSSSGVPTGEIVAAVATGAGVVLKIVSEIKKARESS